MVPRLIGDFAGLDLIATNALADAAVALAALIEVSFTRKLACVINIGQYYDKAVGVGLSA